MLLAPVGNVYFFMKTTPAGSMLYIITIDDETCFSRLRCQTLSKSQPREATADNEIINVPHARSSTEAVVLKKELLAMLLSNEKRRLLLPLVTTVLKYQCSAARPLHQELT